MYTLRFIDYFWRIINDNYDAAVLNAHRPTEIRGMTRFGFLSKNCPGFVVPPLFLYVCVCVQTVQVWMLLLFWSSQRLTSHSARTTL